MGFFFFFCQVLFFLQTSFAYLPSNKSPKPRRPHVETENLHHTWLSIKWEKLKFTCFHFREDCRSHSALIAHQSDCDCRGVKELICSIIPAVKHDIVKISASSPHVGISDFESQNYCLNAAGVAGLLWFLLTSLRAAAVPESFQHDKKKKVLWSKQWISILTSILVFF